MLIQTEVGRAEVVAKQVAALPGVLSSEYVTGPYDVVVRIGGKHHVRAIQRVAPNGDLVFFSAIDEGVVLTMCDRPGTALADCVPSRRNSMARPSCIASFIA